MNGSRDYQAGFKSGYENARNYIENGVAPLENNLNYLRQRVHFLQDLNPETADWHDGSVAGNVAAVAEWVLAITTGWDGLADSGLEIVRSSGLAKE